MSVANYKDLLRHYGHTLACVRYGPCAFGTEEPMNIAIECETCCEVLLDFDRVSERHNEKKILEQLKGLANQLRHHRIDIKEVGK